MARFGFARTYSRKVGVLDFWARARERQQGACAPSWSEGTDADDQPAHSQAAGCAAREEEGAGLAAESAKARRLHPRLHDDAEEAELGVAQGRQGPADQRLRSDRLHPRRGP